MCHAEFSSASQKKKERDPETSSGWQKERDPETILNQVQHRSSEWQNKVWDDKRKKFRMSKTNKLFSKNFSFKSGLDKGRNII